MPADLRRLGEDAVQLTMQINEQKAYGFRLLDIVEAAKRDLFEMTEPSVSTKPSAEKWSAKEILGHLVDTTTNYHQRFIRAVGSGGLEFPGYEQDHWVKVHRYDDAIWVELVQLWGQFNKFLAHTIQNLPNEELDTRCTIGGGESVTLEFLIEDYIRHMLHHLSQIREAGRG